MNLVTELQTMKSTINAIIDQMIQKIEYNENSSVESSSLSMELRNYEVMYPLSSQPIIFKGKKPTGIIFNNNMRKNVGTWRNVFAEVLNQCNSDSEVHVQLMNLRGIISGRTRVFLAESGDAMRSPLKIDTNLFVETHYDTETLMRILTDRILAPIGYDFSQIQIAIRND